MMLKLYVGRETQWQLDNFQYLDIITLITSRAEIIITCNKKINSEEASLLLCLTSDLLNYKLI